MTFGIFSYAENDFISTGWESITAAWEYAQELVAKQPSHDQGKASADLDIRPVDQSGITGATCRVIS